MNYEIIIDGKIFSYNNQFISGKQIRKIGKLPIETKIWFKVNKACYKIEINMDDTIDLARRGPEEFLTNI